MNMALDVQVFQSACDQKPSEENATLYHKLINEEFNEFLEAYQNQIQNDSFYYISGVA